MPPDSAPQDAPHEGTSDSVRPATANHVTDADVSPPRGNPFPIVGIGASAGGLEAFVELLRHLSSDTGMAFVLVQHLDPRHTSLLPELIVPATPMPVVTVEDGLQVQPNHVYVIPANSTMVLEDGHLRLAPREPGLHLPIDIFFQSLAHVQGGRAIGVVLSGNASDGSQGVRAIKAECGLTFAQDEVSARFSGMPRNAVATGAIDFVLPPSEIGRELSELSRNPFLIPPHRNRVDSEILPDGDGELNRIFALLQAATKVDFRHYRLNTVRRRISRRLIVQGLDNLTAYVAYLERHPAEVEDLFRDLLITVTSFFREPATFEALRKLLSGMLSECDERSGGLRVWTPGCATGEEVYSLAICIHELLEERSLAPAFQIFGTDVSSVALERARAGTYSETIADDVSPERLRRFFVRTDGGFQIGKLIRESCIFARHDLTRDPPFGQIDLVSCRNVLIYLDPTLQRRILPLFHYALKPTGLLMLGTAESTGAAPDLFTTVDNQHHIYGRKATPVRLPMSFVVDQHGTADVPPPRKVMSATGVELQKNVEQIINTKYSPDAVVVDGDMQILQFRGQTSPYIAPAAGEATLNLLRMVPETLVLPLRRGIAAAAKGRASVIERGVVAGTDGDHEEVQIEITPVHGASTPDCCYLIVFTHKSPRMPAEATATATADPGALKEEAVLRLERELADTLEQLRNLREDYEAHAEELSASNEEARSANEELQSTNEELRTTKEELQSANEELTTVNDELRNRNSDLNLLNSDLTNLLAAVSLPILMADRDLRLRRFNNAAEKLLQLGALDMARPIGHVNGPFYGLQLDRKARTVLERLHLFEEEVQDGSGHWYTVTIRPYRTPEQRIDGVVITFQDIDPLKRSLRAAEEARDYAEGMIATMREPLVVLDPDLRVQRATNAFLETFLVSREETEGRLLYDLGNGQWNKPRLRELLGLALFHDEPFFDYEIEHDFPHVGRRTMRLNGRRIPRHDSERRTLLLAIEDVTERRETAEIRFQRLFEAARDGIAVIDAENGVVLDVNPWLLQLTGFARHHFTGRPLADGPFGFTPEVATLVAEANEKEMVRYDDTYLACANGGRLPVEIISNRYHVGARRVIQMNVRDIGGRKAEAALRELWDSFRLFIDSVRDYALFQLDVEGNIISWNTGAQRLLGWEEAEIIGRSVDVVFTPEDIAKGEPAREMETARRAGCSEDERWHVRRDGSRFFADGVLTTVSGEAGGVRGYAKVMRDITRRREQDERLQRSLEEKSVLVREIHHRVKNNLQVIVSLLGIQADRSADPKLLAAFEETEGRVRAIARIHESLYASRDLSEIEFGAYLTQLVRELLALHTSDPNHVALDLRVTDMVISIEQAIPLGLIANELIVNSLKHGLSGRSGSLTVVLGYLPETVRAEEGQTLDEGWASLEVRDSGAGLPAGLDVHRANSMGLHLVNLLVRQLRGRLELRAVDGASFAVMFPLTVRERDS